MDANDYIIHLNEANATTDTFKIKDEITGKTGSNGTKNVKIMIPLKYLSYFCRTIEILLIICEINLDLNWSKYCFKVATDVAQQGALF